MWKFPNSPDALEAVTNARKVYIEEGNLNDYVAWIATLSFINSTNSQLETTTFAVAEKKYLDVGIVCPEKNVLDGKIVGPEKKNVFNEIAGNSLPRKKKI